MVILGLPLLMLSGCVDLVVTHTVDLPASGVETLRLRADRGNMDLWGVTEGRFEVEVKSWSSGSGDTRANEREAANDWGALVYDDVLELWGLSRAAFSGVNFTVRGPTAVTTDVVVLNGEVDLWNLTGGNTVTATHIYGRDLSGDLDLFADESVDVQVFPQEGDVIELYATHGDITLGLPDGGEYDIEVFTKRAKDIQITNLSFDSYGGEPGYFRSTTGEGKVRIRVFAGRGNFYLVDSGALAR